MGGPALIDGQNVRSTDNFLIAPTTIDGLVHRSAEHYYQYAKFDQSGGGDVLKHCQGIVTVENAGSAWGMGQSRRYPLISNFEERKAGLMYRAVRAKFEQHPELAAELLATQGPVRAAASTADWQRTNSLILERVRHELRRMPPPLDAEQWAALVRLTGGADAWTDADAREEGCGGTCEQCAWAVRRRSRKNSSCQLSCPNTVER